MSRRAKQDFSVAVLPEPSISLGLAPLRFLITSKVGETIHFDLTDLPSTAAVRELAQAMHSYMQAHRPTRRVDFPYSNLRGAIRTFSGVLTQHEIRDLGALTRDHVNEVESTLFATGAYRTAEVKLGLLFCVLRELPEGRLAPEVRARLDYLTLRPRPKVTPRDAYSEYVAEQIRRGARRMLPKTLERFTVAADALLRDGVDPRHDTRGWTRPANVLWELAATGPFGAAEWCRRSGLSNSSLYSLRLTELNASIFPTPVDLVPFWILLMLETGLPPSAALNLTTDCLHNSRNGRADLVYYKARAGRQIVEGVRDGNLNTPGGLIRAVISITKRLRNVFQMPDGTRAENLWLTISSYHLCGQLSRFQTTTNGSGAIEKFCKIIGLVDDDGEPMDRFEPARLRKTHKALFYKQTKGQLEDLAHDHTTRVAIAHYGNIEALRETHERTVADGLNDALDSALKSTILTPESEDSLSASEAVEALLPTRISLPVLRSALAGESDVWLASCTGFFNSPWGSAGAPCPAATWGCLDCENAVITSRKLPAIFAFLDHMLREREVMDTEEWALKYGRAHTRITQQILPRFTSSQLIEARAIAASNQDLLYLPPELYLREVA
jgi:hypothetical protein